MFLSRRELTQIHVLLIEHPVWRKTASGVMHKVRSLALNAVGPVSLIQLDEKLREGAEGREVEDTVLKPVSAAAS